MFEGTRLSYIVPGYTGHIPKIQRDDIIFIQNKEPKYQIPGYDGYVHSIKSENIFGKTYGKITYAISNGEQSQGQDVPACQRYSSATQEAYVNQFEVLQRTAADIVGVQPNQFAYQLTEKMRSSKFWNDQKEKALNQKQKENSINENFQVSNSQFYGDQQKKALKIGTPLPGYTGTNKRVIAANIFGQTFANARRTALQDQINIDNERKNNFKKQSQAIPPIKK